MFFGDVSLSHEFKGRHGVDHKSGGASRSVKNKIKIKCCPPNPALKTEDNLLHFSSL